MSRTDAWLVHLSTLAVGGTGLVYAWMRYLLEAPDPWAVVHHPWQPFVQHAHLWTAPLLVFAAGVIWRQHVWRHFRQGVRARRRSGLGLLGALVPMVVSGYLIQTSVSPAWRKAWVGIHLVASAVWLVSWAGHLVASRRQVQVPDHQCREGWAPASEATADGLGLSPPPPPRG